MKKYVNPIVMVLIGVLICVLAEGVDQRTVVKKKNVKIDQSKLTYDEADQYRRSLPDREPDNNNLVALKTNLLPYGLPGRQKGWYGDLLAEKLGVEVHYVWPSLFEEREKSVNMDMFLFMGTLDYYDVVKAEMWEHKNGKYVVLKDWSTEEWANKDEDYVEYSDYSTDYFYPRTLIYLIPNTFLGAELTGVKISRM